MPTSEARIRANQANAARSTGPKTPEGKERSRANAFKHGLTGNGVVLPEADVLEVARKAAAYRAELAPSGEVGRDLANRAALLAVRMSRCVDQRSAALADRVRRAEADFEAPEGLDDQEAARLRAEAGRRAMFDPSKEATLARQYEAAAERGYYRALKELRQQGRPARAGNAIDAERDETQALMGSFFAMKQEVDEMDAFYAELERTLPPLPTDGPSQAPSRGGVDVPITVGRRR